MQEHLAVLNSAQREAVAHSEGSLLILAGAGSGKTRVITTKIAWLIKEMGIDPRSILALTFTNKAAREMAERATAMEELASDAMLRTFHSFGAWFLRRYAPIPLGNEPPLFKLADHFVIYDNDDSIQLLSTVASGLPRARLAQAFHKISRAKDYNLAYDDAELIQIDGSPEFRSLYTAYEKRLREIGNVDFGDLISLPLTLLRHDTALRERFRQRFKVILVDEYQDSNVAQFKLLRELAGPETYLCVVGDDDQSIYRFRGAEVRNILDFPERVAGTTVIRLEENYRSHASILRVAEAVVSQNTGRLGKTMKAVRGEGEKPVLAFLPNQDEEAEFCASLIENSTAPFKNWAILYRTNAQSLTFETLFLRRNIPYRVVGSLKFYEREEIKDALALAAFLLNSQDEIAFRRIINKPARGFGAKTLNRIIERAKNGAGEDYGNFQLALEREVPLLPARASSGGKDFLAFIAKARSILEDEGSAELPSEDSEALLLGGEGLSQFFVSLLLNSGIAEYHSADDAIAGTQRVANLQELVNAAVLYKCSFEGLSLFLEHIELDRAGQEEETEDAVTLITIHNTKGLEFPHVIITGVEQGIFPREDKMGEDLEEERRLFYVGATRAMDKLYFTACSQRRLYGRIQFLEPSLFLKELPLEEVHILGRAPSYFFPKRRVEKARSYGEEGIEKDVEKGSSIWPKGTRVYHDDYGYGVVFSIEQKDPYKSATLNIAFESGFRKDFDFEAQRGQLLKVDGYA